MFLIVSSIFYSHITSTPFGLILTKFVWDFQPYNMWASLLGCLLNKQFWKLFRSPYQYLCIYTILRAYLYCSFLICDANYELWNSVVNVYEIYMKEKCDK